MVSKWKDNFYLGEILVKVIFRQVNYNLLFLTVPMIFSSKRMRLQRFQNPRLENAPFFLSKIANFGQSKSYLKGNSAILNH